MAKAETSTQVAVRSSQDVAAIEELERLLLSGERIEVVDDPQAISQEIVAQLLGAKTDEELESMGQAVGWRELLDLPVEIRGFRWRPSSFEEGSNVFFVVNAIRLDTGEDVILTTGARNVLAQLANMAKRGTLVGAVRMCVRAEKPTANGYYPLWLKTPPGSERAA